MKKDTQSHANAVVTTKEGCGMQRCHITESGELSDGELLARAHEWRREALRGVLHARGYAHELEAEMRRRFVSAATLRAPLETINATRRSRPWWRLW